MDFEKTLLNCTPVYPEAKNKIHMLSAFGEGKQRNHGIGIRSTATRKRPGDATIAINGRFTLRDPRDVATSMYNYTIKRRNIPDTYSIPEVMARLMNGEFLEGLRHLG